MRETLGGFLSELLQMRQLSNRALAMGAGVSESVIRNLLQHGINPRAKDPDPRTLRAVADYLDIDALKLFRLAGYVPPPPNAVTPRAEFLAEVFDRLPADKQDAVMRMLGAFAERSSDRFDIQEMVAHMDNPVAGLDTDSPNLLRLIANQIILHTGALQAGELDIPNNFDPEWPLPTGSKWKDVVEDTKRRVLALAKAKLDLNYDPTMLDAKWRRQ